MMNFKLTPKAVAQNMNYQDLIKVMVEYKKLNPDYDIDFNELALEAEREFKEAPIREIIYSNEMVDVCIGIFEGSITSIEDEKISDEIYEILDNNIESLIEWNNNLGIFDISKSFRETLERTQSDNQAHIGPKKLYDFNHIQDEIFYTIYPDKR